MFKFLRTTIISTNTSSFKIIVLSRIFPNSNTIMRMFISKSIILFINTYWVITNTILTRRNTKFMCSIFIYIRNFNWLKPFTNTPK